MAIRRKGDTAMPWRTERSSCSRLRELSWLLAGGAALFGAWPQGVRADAALEEVVVTAERRTEKAQDVPVAITAVSADRKSTRLNSSHLVISYAVFCLKKKNYT